MANPRWRYMKMQVSRDEAAILETAFRFIEDHQYDWYTLQSCKFEFAGNVRSLQDAIEEAGDVNRDPVGDTMKNEVEVHLQEQRRERA